MENFPELPRVGRPVKMDAFHHVEEAMARVRTKEFYPKLLDKTHQSCFLRAFLKTLFAFKIFIHVAK